MCTCRACSAQIKLNLSLRQLRFHCLVLRARDNMQKLYSLVAKGVFNAHQKLLMYISCPRQTKVFKILETQQKAVRFLKSNSQSLSIKVNTMGKFGTDSQTERLPIPNNRTEKNFLPKEAKKVHRRTRQAAILTHTLFKARA